MTVSYNAEYEERGCRKGVYRGGREEVSKGGSNTVSYNAEYVQGGPKKRAFSKNENRT